MDAVFRIADRITVMVNGAVIASGARGRPRSPRCRPPTWAGIDGAGDDELLLDARGPARLVRQSHVLHGVGLQIARARRVGLLGRNGMGKSTLIRTPAGPRGAARRAASSCSAGRVARPPHEVARLGVAYVPEGRGIFPNLSVRENLVMAARPGPTAATTGPSSA
jgi:ABC-type sugar transport system ATPase subunit